MLEELGKLIYRCVPSGQSVRESPHPLMEQINLNQLRCGKLVNLERAAGSLGTLGGGNHFIEADVDEEENPEWNYSAPHGAGRLMSRSKTKETLNMERFTQSMEGIYTTSVHESAIDEAPMAYNRLQHPSHGGDQQYYPANL